MAHSTNLLVRKFPLTPGIDSPNYLNELNLSYVNRFRKAKLLQEANEPPLYTKRSTFVDEPLPSEQEEML